MQKPDRVVFDISRGDGGVIAKIRCEPTEPEALIAELRRTIPPRFYRRLPVEAITFTCRWQTDVWPPQVELTPNRGSGKRRERRRLQNCVRVALERWYTSVVFSNDQTSSAEPTPAHSAAL